MASVLERLTCAIHLDYFEIPKRLPECSHIFCQGCIDGLPQSEPGYIACPQCRKEQKLPAGGAADLITDLLAQNLVQDFKCVCGEVSEATRDCDRCHIKFCPDCAGQHSRPVKCRIFSSTETLRQLMSEQFKWEITAALNEHLEQVEKIQAVEIEVEKALKYIWESLTILKDRLLSQLPDLSEAKKTVNLLKNIHSCNLFEKSELMLRYADTAEIDLTNHAAEVQTMVDRVRRPDLLEQPLPMTGADELLGKVLSVVGCLRDYTDTTIASVAEPPDSDEPSDVAWHPVDNRICVTSCKEVFYFRPYKAIEQNIVSSWSKNTSIIIIHITARGEELWSDGFNVGLNPGEDIVLLREYPDDPFVAMASHDEGEARLLYLLTVENVYYTTLSSGVVDHCIGVLELDVKLENATDIAVDRCGNLYIVDCGKKSIFVFTKYGRLIHALRESLPGVALYKPMGICVDPYGNIMVTDAEQHCVHIYDSGLRYRISLRDDENPLRTPSRVAVDKLKRVFVVDTSRKEVVIFNQPPG